MMTKAGAQRMMQLMPNVRQKSCVIRGHYRTHVFEFPKAAFVGREHMPPVVIIDREDERATLVSDLLKYFTRESRFQHYEICCALRSHISQAIKTFSKNTDNKNLPLFLTLEKQTLCETPMENGTCFEIDEVDESGNAMIVGGRSGDRATIVCKVRDAPWPSIDEDSSYFVNRVLGAAQVVQSDANAVREIVNSSCFYDENGHPVRSTTLDGSAELTVVQRTTNTDVQEKVEQMHKLICAFEGARSSDVERECLDNLVESLRLTTVGTDELRRERYLALFDAMMRVLGNDYNHKFYRKHKDRRHQIAHPSSDTVLDLNEFYGLRRDAMAEIRHLFLGGSTSGKKMKRARRSKK